jgi:hypothetical protein
MALGTSSSVGMLVRGNSNLITSAFPIGDIIYYQQMVILLMFPSASGSIVRIVGYSRGTSFLYFLSLIILGTTCIILINKNISNTFF